MTEFSEVANQFATTLIQGNFTQAQTLLAESLKAETPPAKLQESYEAMLAYTNGAKAETTEVVNTMTDWPNKQTGDIGWAYVAISGQTFSEGVTVTVCEEGGKPCIREVVWGRP
jgi:outer membrane protein assembly factor BamD (BamD/ComL family)